MTNTATAEPASKKQSKRRFAREPESTAQTAALPSTTALPSPAPAKPSKISSVIALLQREQGATLAEMIEATGWLPHTTRAALTGLKKKGRVLEKSKREDLTCYRIVSQG